jgi:gamma-glutamylcyclotransferase (GGCT)/AIG2-like uncharacterized protein YtfP
MDEERFPFFVYGTLLPEQPNAHLWGDAVMQSEKAMLAGGCLYDLGSYPMLVEEGDGMVTGVVQTVAEAEYGAVLMRLDQLEGYDPEQLDETWYRRVVRDVKLANGLSLQAWVYVGHKAAVQGLNPIPSGDWAAYTAKTFQNIEQWWRDVAFYHGLHEPPDEEA